ncbi:D-alanyl-D-alanine carboxypeptidase family protein [Caldisalinibacter kiritimatiensis]|uniref:serine-type D-Ala-D-Ala carboxypeptidase n=1 Tax=Caldisalinibacter kiritimatiensis TaxID=1304284 RepID=R1CFK9_9FIRM|nr:D-alanyl-D-alanine carboxypeptidase family protein [Caldisalinibacter kiritimatiensis]EOD01085.1 D-alanyl-D-alanine carboxypeptidase [Caldisalinibacter kiritimatiensis]
MIKKSIILSICIIMLCSNLSFADSPSIEGQSGILIEADSGRILYSHNINRKLPMASTTKIMTALIALENGNLDDIVKVDKKSVGVEGSSIYLYEGEEISLKDLLYGLMLRSGNDSAVAIAKHIGGTVENFVDMMNKKAKEIGAYNTNFTNPHGLSDRNHYTTAYDLALITREAMKNQHFKNIVKTKLWIADRKRNRYFCNKNKTVFQYSGGDGVKIGYTTAAGRCLVASATRNNMQLIAVVLNDYNWFNDCYGLFDYGFENYISYIVFDKGQLAKTVYVDNGQKEYLPLITADKFLIPLKESEKGKIKTVIKAPDKVEAPIIKGKSLGTVEVYLKGKLIHKENLLAKENIKEKNTLDKIYDFIQNLFK